MTVVVVILATCILLEAFFSGAEIALVSADKVKLRHYAEEVGRAGPRLGRSLREKAAARRGKLILDFLEDPGVLISTSLVGTNICVVLSTVVATLAFTAQYPRHAELLSLAVMTPLVLVFGEIVPKSLFQNYADTITPRAIYALWFFRFLFYPFVAMGGWLSNLMYRILGLDQQQKSPMSREELSLLIRLPSPEGEDRITPDERRMVTRIFEFKETDVEQIMIHLSEVTALPDDATMEEMAREISDKSHTRLPIYSERLDNIVGVVHAFEVLRASRDQKLADLCRPPIFVPESQLAIDTLMRLQREGQGMAVVVDEYGGATGVVTIEDILEEIVGFIDDEYDADERELIIKEPQGTYKVKGRTEVERVNQTLKLNLPEDDEDYESIAGLILDQLKRIPEVGEEVVINGVTLLVTRATRRSIEEVRIRPGKKK